MRPCISVWGRVCRSVCPSVRGLATFLCQNWTVYFSDCYLSCDHIYSFRTIQVYKSGPNYTKWVDQKERSGKHTWAIVSQPYFGQICPPASDYVSIKIIWCQIEILLLTWCQNIPDGWNHATWWVIIPCVNIKSGFHLYWLSFNYDWFRICYPWSEIRNARRRSLK